MRFDLATYVEEHLNVTSVSGDEACVDCPSCGKAQHCYVNVDSGSYICFKCEFKGKGTSGLVRFVATVEDVDENAARRIVFDKAGVVFRRRGKTTEELVGALGGDVADVNDVDEINEPLPPEFIPVFDGSKWRYPLYMKRRGFARETASTRGLGFCESGRYAKRVIIPVKCPNGSAFTARYIGDHEVRYLNPKGVDFGRLLFGWSPSTSTGSVILVEGPLDELMMYQHGLPTLGIGGKALKDGQLALLCARPASDRIIVMLDPEEASAPYKIARQLMCHFTHVHVAKLPDGVDPGSSTRAQALDAYDHAQRYAGERIGIEGELQESAHALGMYSDLT